MTEYKTAAEYAEETKNLIVGKIDEKTAPLDARLSELEQRGALRGPGDMAPPSAGQQFVDSEEFKGLMTNLHAGRRVGIETKATITSLTTDANGSAGDLINPQRGEVYVGPKRRMTIRDLLPVVQVSSGSVEYAKQTGYTNSADTVAEATLKPQSELKYDIVTVPIRTIAHWVIASRIVLDDAPQLRGLIDTELLYGLQFVEEDQLLNGGGTGTDLNGLVTQATAFSTALEYTAPNKLDVLGAALLQNSLAEEPATGIVLHPSDWMDIRLTKNTDGEYLLGAPGAAVEPRLFGIPIVSTQAMTQGDFLVGNFQAATLYDRWQSRVELSTEDGEGFRRNEVTILAEERIGLALKNTLAFTTGDFAAAITAMTAA